MCKWWALTRCGGMSTDEISFDGRTRMYSAHTKVSQCTKVEMGSGTCWNASITWLIFSVNASLWNVYWLLFVRLSVECSHPSRDSPLLYDLPCLAVVSNSVMIFLKCCFRDWCSLCRVCCGCNPVTPLATLKANSRMCRREQTLGSFSSTFIMTLR